MAFMGEVAWVRLERRLRRRGCVVVVVVVVIGSDEDAATFIACGDCCMGVVWPSCWGVALLLSSSRLRRNLEAISSLTSTSIFDSSSSSLTSRGSAMGEGDGDDGLNGSSASESQEEKSERRVSRYCRRGVCGARRPEEKKEE